MKWKTEVILFTTVMSMQPFIFSFIVGFISRPDKWLDVSFVMFIVGLILFPFVYIVIHNILPKEHVSYLEEG